MAEQLLASMARPWKPAEYKDEFRPRLKALLEHRARHGPTATPAEPTAQPERGKVLDLMGLLQQSLARANEGRPAHAPRRRAPRRGGRRAPARRRRAS